MKQRWWKRMKKFLGIASLVLCTLATGGPGAFAQGQDSVAAKAPQMVEIEYGGKIISVDIADMTLMKDRDGNRSIELVDPEKYEQQLRDAPVYGEGKVLAPADASPEKTATTASNLPTIGRREYEEEERARAWANVVEDLAIREVDQKALALVEEFRAAKSAVPPVLGSAGSVVMTYSSYTPRIVCRPMYVTDILLQPGEIVTGVHPGDPVRWQFAPGQSGAGDGLQIHVLIKPLMADISTNLIINTDRRTYQLELLSSATNFIPSVSFSYPDDSQKEWETFIAKKREEKNVLASGYSINPEDLHLDYEIRGKDSLRWKPRRVWDDGVKTYIQFAPGSARKSVEAPVFVVYEHKRQIIANYRAVEDMYIVDRVFDKAALLVGTGAAQDRVVITRLSSASKNRRG